MAYTPKQWVCGETITADGLNNMEEGIQEALQSGFECTETEVVFFNGSITTSSAGSFAMGSFTPTQPISGDTLTVTMNGTEYELPKGDLGGGQVYYGEISGGAPVFTNYPCLVMSWAGLFATANPGTYTVKMEGVSETITTTSCFSKAVKSLVTTLKHILDGEADGSLRSNLSTPEENGYALGYGAVALGLDTRASGFCSYAEGSDTTASGQFSHAEGSESVASDEADHAEGGGTTASGGFSHSEGVSTNAEGYASHAEGSGTTASGDRSHAEGGGTTASGEDSHAEGEQTTASGTYSHAQNYGTIAQGSAQTAIGRYNVAQGTATVNPTDYAFIIGNGANGSARSNAFAIKWDGTFVFADGTEITPAQFAALKALL